jgi:hypothetical protein
MQNGMDDRGYDCSGLVIASVCEIVKIETSNWPRQYRHLLQIFMLRQDITARDGDMLIFYDELNRWGTNRIHTGIKSGENQVVHVSGITNRIEEGAVDGVFRKIATVPIETLVNLAQDSVH